MSGSALPRGDTVFQGGAFHPDLVQGRASGGITVDIQGVHFVSGKGRVDLPVEGLEIKLGGAGDRLIFFSHPGHPNVTIHTPDHGILKHPEIVRHPSLVRQVGVVRTKKRTATTILLGVVAVFFALVIGVILSKDRLVWMAANAIPVEWEVKMGDTVFKQIEGGSVMMNDPEIAKQLELITGPLVKGIGDAKYPFKFHIVEDPSINAFALPGGNVVLHTGLLLAAEEPGEVAGVLGHEIAHVTRRHGFRNIISSAGLFLVLQAVVGDASSLLAVIANNSALLMNRKFSRDFEREADDTGWDYMLQAGIDPHGMISFFHTMKKEEQKHMEKLPEGTDKALAFLSTHPATDERIANLNKKAEKLGSYKPTHTFALNYGDFKDTLRNKLHTAPTDKGKGK